MVWDPPDGVEPAAAFADGAAGLVSTADDLLAFARMLLRGGDPVLRPAAVGEMTSDQLTPGAEGRGGLGPDVLRRPAGGFGRAVCEAAAAFGWDGGLGTSLLVDPAHDLAVIVLTQRMFESPQPPQVHRDIQAAAYAAVG